MWSYLEYKLNKILSYVLNIEYFYHFHSYRFGEEPPVTAYLSARKWGKQFLVHLFQKLLLIEGRQYSFD